MTKQLQILAVTGLFLLAACRGDRAPREQQPNYQTVEEGQASGVTSTIHGPGETVPPMTGTNADTTSAFTINPALASAPATPPGTLAGSLPNQPYGGSGIPGYVPPPPPPPRGDTTSRTMTPPPPVTTTTPAEEPPPVTTTTQAPPTETAPPPTPPEEKTETETQEKTETTSTTPPPPPPPPAAASR